MIITVIGTGYVGLVTGACPSDVGIDVACIDIDQNKIDGRNLYRREIIGEAGFDYFGIGIGEYFRE